MNSIVESTDNIDEFNLNKKSIQYGVNEFKKKRVKKIHIKNNETDEEANSDEGEADNCVYFEQ